MSMGHRSILSRGASGLGRIPWTDLSQLTRVVQWPHFCPFNCRTGQPLLLGCMTSAPPLSCPDRVRFRGCLKREVWRDAVPPNRTLFGGDAGGVAASIPTKRKNRGAGRPPHPQQELFKQSLST